MPQNFCVTFDHNYGRFYHGHSAIFWTNIDRGLSKEEEFGLGGLSMDEPITWARSKRSQEEIDKRLNSLMEEREEEVKFIYFSKLLE